jgi:hypothetical protein
MRRRRSRVIKAMQDKTASVARAATGYTLRDGVQPVDVASHDPAIRIETVSGAKGVIIIVLILSSEVKRGAQ